MRGEVQLAIVVPGYRLGNKSEMQAGADSGEEQLVLVEPGEPGGVVKEKMRFAA